MSDEQTKSMVDQVRDLLAASKNKQKIADDSGVALKTLYRFIEGENITLDTFSKIVGPVLKDQRRLGIARLQSMGMWILRDHEAINATESQIELLEKAEAGDYMGAMETLMKMKQASELEASSQQRRRANKKQK